MADPRTEQAVELMTRFAEGTGLASDRPPRRYLWTDAFAVCNFLALRDATGDAAHADLALRLVDRVHHVLGRHRADDPRGGWISGLGPQEGAAHPTRGGLRIGKPLPERGPTEPMDDRLEWERDGQYFHYLAKWMHALDQVARSTGTAQFAVWARELADTAHRTFTYVPRGGTRKRMYWKMSIDLSRPMVASMGQHDPLDGFVTCVQIEATAAGLEPPVPGPSLREAAADFAAMIEPDRLVTDDPLGLGGLLVDAYRVQQLTEAGALSSDEDLFPRLLAAARVGMRHYLEQPDLGSPADRRLAFRELGLAIGLAAVERMHRHAGRAREGFAGSAQARASLDELARYAAVRAEIEAFWLRPEHRRTRTWVAHADINDVMLATSLVPEGFLVLRDGGAP